MFYGVTYGIGADAKGICAVRTDAVWNHGIRADAIRNHEIRTDGVKIAGIGNYLVRCGTNKKLSENANSSTSMTMIHWRICPTGAEI